MLTRRRAAFGLGRRDGALGELLRGALFSLPFLAALIAVLALTGVSTPSLPDAVAAGRRRPRTVAATRWATGHRGPWTARR